MMTKKYRLKKDLPTFKAGEILEITNNGNLVKRGECASDCMVVLDKNTLGRFPYILDKDSEWFEEIPEQPKTVLDLQRGDRCCYISGDGYIEEYRWDDDSIDHERRDAGSIFLTREEAEKESAQREMKIILKGDTKGFKPDWNDDADKYEVYYDSRNKSLCTWRYTHACSHQDLWFATEEDAEASIEAHPREWKAYLGVKGKENG